MWSFRRPGGNGMELASSDAAAILFFLEEEKEKNRGANRADSVAHPYKGSQKIHGIATTVCALARNDASIREKQIRRRGNEEVF